ncbi:MAG TPA: dipeptide epimerase [Trebonia sp.]|nr:dipeptide epimerase [Trebonia sp.]
MTIHRRSVPLVRPFVTAVRVATQVDAVLVEVRDSDGRSGWGEAPTSWRVTGESAASVTAAVEGPLSAAVAGLPADDPAGASEALKQAVVGNSSARMAVECAVYDLAARVAGVPLFRYLGGRENVLRTDMTLSAAATPTQARELVRTAVAQAAAGFSTLKVKTGAGGDDVALLAAVRQAVGPHVTLRADANQGWTPQQAVAVISAWEDAGLGVELVEQPVHRDDLDGLAFVTARVATPVLADEAVWTRRDFRQVVALHAADLVNIKLAKAGGLHEALALARLAAECGVGVFVGCMSESHVGIAAAAAFASALAGSSDATGTGLATATGSATATGTEPTTSTGPATITGTATATATVPQDLDAGLWLTASPVDGGVAYEGESITLPDTPGTGIDGLAA